MAAPSNNIPTLPVEPAPTPQGPGGWRQRFDSLRGPGLKASTIRGTAWTVLGHGGEQVLRLGSNLILARLLAPDMFGLMAIVAVTFTGLKMFSDVGVGPSIIQNKRDDTDFLNTAWTVQALRGFALWIVCAALALPLAWFYNEPTLALLLPIVGVSNVFAGFQTTAFFTLNKKLELGRLSFVKLSGQTIGAAARIGFALLSPTVWALAFGGMLAALCTTVIGFLVLPSHRHRFRLERQALASLFGFGRWIFLSTCVMFLAMQADRFVIPALGGMTTLGIYSMALMLANAPLAIVNMIASRVMFPAYSRVFREKDAGALAPASRRFALAVTPAFLAPAVMIVAGRLIIDVLYDARYALAGDFLVILGIAAYLDMLRASLNGVFLASGDSKAPFIVNSIRLGLGLPVAVALMIAFGPTGFCVGQVVASGSAYLAQRYLARKKLQSGRARTDEVLLVVLLAIVAAKSLATSYWGVPI